MIQWHAAGQNRENAPSSNSAPAELRSGERQAPAPPRWRDPMPDIALGCVALVAPRG